VLILVLISIKRALCCLQLENAFAIEIGAAGLVHRSAAQHSKPSLEADLSGTSTLRRWILLETPAPEERVVAAACVSTGAELGHGRIEHLAVEPSMQQHGVGSLLLRRAEGILLSLRCRWVNIQTTQWRSDVLAWASSRGYSEVGGGLLPAESTTRSTRYLDLRHDLLADAAVVKDFGEGSARFAAAVAGSGTENSAADEQSGDEHDDDALLHSDSVAITQPPVDANAISSPAAKQQKQRSADASCGADSDAEGTMQSLASVFKSLGVGDMMSAVNSTSNSSGGNNAGVPHVANDRDLSSMEGLLSGLLASLNTDSGKDVFDRLAEKPAAT
jgi:GNAT superfamily N-acetyltransferase